MTKAQEIYIPLIEDVGEKGWKKSSSAFRVGNAGIAITVSFLTDGRLHLAHLKKQIPDFSQSELRTALKELKQNRYFEKDKKGDYKLSVDKDTSIEDTIFWALLANVVNGFIKRVTE